MATGRECTTSPCTEGRMALEGTGLPWALGLSSPRLSRPRTQLISFACSVASAVPRAGRVMSVLPALNAVSAVQPPGAQVFMLRLSGKIPRSM
ncbi:hypothetical protein D3C72_1642070 [compost metagenome]